MSKVTRRSGGIGFCGLLTIVFITLKLTNVIQWSWIWVLSPLWISAGITIIMFVLILAIWIWANSGPDF